MATVVNKTIKASGGNYASLNAFDAGEQRDLTAVDEIAQATCYAFADSTAATLDGWVTDSTRYINLTAATAHGGVWNTGVYRLAAPDGSNCLQLRANHVHIAGLQFYLTNSSAVNRRAIVADTQDAGSYIYITHCILAATLTGSALDIGILAVDTDVQMLVRNTLVYNFANSGSGNGYGIQAYWGTLACQNVTIVDGDYGFRQASTSTMTCTNCGAANCTTGFSGTITQEYCSSSTPTFVGYASDDFHLARADTVWRKNGENLGIIGFTIDIDGDTRGDIWDIGADEYTGVTSLPPTTLAPTTLAPTTLAPTTLAPTTLAPTTTAPTTLAPTTCAPTEVWSQALTFNYVTQYSIRNLLPAAKISDPGFSVTAVRVKFTANAVLDGNIAGASIGLRSGSTISYQTGKFVRLTFGGLDSVAIPAGSSVWSDWAYFPWFDEAVDMLVHIDMGNSNGKYNPTTGDGHYYKTGSYSDAMVESPTGYSYATPTRIASALEVGDCFATDAPTTLAPTTLAPTTLAPTAAPTTLAPTTLAPTTTEPTTLAPTTLAPTTLAPTTPVPCDIFWDGFESGDLSKWSTTSGAAVSAVAPWEGSYCGDIKDENDYVEKNLANFTELYVSFFWKPAAGWTGTQASLISTRNSAIGTTLHELGLFFYASNRKIYAYRYNVNIATSADGVLTDDWQRIDWYLKIDNTVGRCVVKHNGVTVIDFTGDTLHIYAAHNRLRFGKMSTFSNSDSFCYIDNVCVSTTGYQEGTTVPPTTLAPTTLAPTTVAPTTLAPTPAPTTIAPTPAPTTLAPTTLAPTTAAPTAAPTTVAPTAAPTTLAPTVAPTTVAPTTVAPTTLAPTTLAPTAAPTTVAPTTVAPTTVAPTTIAPTTPAPTTLAPTTTLTTLAPTTIWVCEKSYESEIILEGSMLSMITSETSEESDIYEAMSGLSEIVAALSLESKINEVLYADGDICW